MSEDLDRFNDIIKHSFGDKPQDTTEATELTIKELHEGSAFLAVSMSAIMDFIVDFFEADTLGEDKPFLTEDAQMYLRGAFTQARLFYEELLRCSEEGDDDDGA